MVFVECSKSIMDGGGVEADWSSLPSDLLTLVVERLVEFVDYLRFVQVCQRWRYAATQPDDYSINRVRFHILRTCHNKLPMLMVESAHSQDKKSRDLYSPADTFPYQIELPHPYYYRFVGSSLGWLMIIDEKTDDIILLNPFTRKTASIPACVDPSGEWHYFFEDEHGIGSQHYFINKGILSSDPSQDPQFEAVIIFGSLGKLAFYTKDGWYFCRRLYFYDAIYFGGHLYAVTKDCHLLELDFKGSGARHLAMLATTPPTTWPTRPSVAYLVESVEGLLMMVKQYGGHHRDQFKKFEVFVLMERRWCEIKNLGKQALFLGNNQSVCVSTLEFPTCQPNCIYYSEYRDGFSPYYREPLREELLIFNLQTMKIQYLRTPKANPAMKYTFPPIWIVPNLREQ